MREGVADLDRVAALEAEDDGHAEVLGRVARGPPDGHVVRRFQTALRQGVVQQGVEPGAHDEEAPVALCLRGSKRNHRTLKDGHGTADRDALLDELQTCVPRAAKLRTIGPARHARVQAVAQHARVGRIVARVGPERRLVRRRVERARLLVGEGRDAVAVVDVKVHQRHPVAALHI